MKVGFPKIDGATVISVSYGASGRIKELSLETDRDQLDLKDLSFDHDAEIEIQHIVKWPENPPTG